MQSSFHSIFFDFFFWCQHSNSMWWCVCMSVLPSLSIMSLSIIVNRFAFHRFFQKFYRKKTRKTNFRANDASPFLFCFFSQFFDLIIFNLLYQNYFFQFFLHVYLPTNYMLHRHSCIEFDFLCTCFHFILFWFDSYLNYT